MTALDYMTDATLRDTMRDEFNATAAASARAVDYAYDPEGFIEIGGCGCGAH